MNEPHGVRVWLPVWAGIALWMIHLTALSALTRSSCVHGTNWRAHVVTLVTAALTVVALVACQALVRDGHRGAALATDGEAAAEAETETGWNLVFVGRFGLVLNAFSLILILYEGSWALWIPPCHP